MPKISSNLAHHFPITAKLNPLHGRNWEHLLKSAFVTRLAIGGVRIEENRPARLKTNDMTPVEKKKAFAERCFVEIFGTIASVVLLHMGQDIAAKFLERVNKNLIQNTRRDSLKEIAAGKLELDPQEFSRAFDKIFGTDSSRIFSRILYGEVNEKGEFVQAIRRNLCKELSIPVDEVDDRLPKAVNRYLRPRLNTYSTLAVLVGVVISATLGGYGIQWINDHPLSAYLRKKYPDTAPAGFLTLPTSFSSTQFGKFSEPENPNPFSKTNTAPQTTFMGRQA